MTNFVFSKRQRYNRYFEGWYFRITNPDTGMSISFIPGFATGKNIKNQHAFIQVLSNNGNTDYLKYPLGEFSLKRDPLTIKIGPNIFSNRYLHLQIAGKIQVKGYVKFLCFTPLKFKLMGPFGLLPNLPCYHKIISMRHEVAGSLLINNQLISWNNCFGYLETDKGHSFPKGYIWLQCNTFHNSKLSFSCSISQIPVGRLIIPVCYALLYTPHKKYHFTTWLGAKTTQLSYHDSTLKGQIRQGKLLLNFSVSLPSIYGLGKGVLSSPVQGEMKAHINETLKATVKISLSRSEQVVIEETGINCGAEITNFSVLKQAKQ